MKTSWWWNNDYEELMKSLTGWTEKHPAATVHQTKFQISPDGKRFYLFLLYSEG